MFRQNRLDIHLYKIHWHGDIIDCFYSVHYNVLYSLTQNVRLNTLRKESWIRYVTSEIIIYLNQLIFYSTSKLMKNVKK